MPEKSGMFDSTADDPRQYAARDFAEYFGRLITNGVFNAGQYLNVSATGQDANVSLSPGAAWINGYAYSVYDAAITLPIQPAAAQDRIDRVILRLDTSTPVRAIKAIVLQGLPGATPSPPALVRSGNIYDISLARILIKANTSIVLPANITDERLDNTICGLVNSLIKVDTTIFQQKWDAFMATLQNAGYVTGATYNTHLADNVSHVHYGPDMGTANAKVVNINSQATAYEEGMAVAFKNKTLNTGAVTIDVNGLGPKSILKSNGSAVASGNLKANSIYTVRYNGSAFILQGEGGEYGTATANDVRKGTTFGSDDGLVPGALDLTNLTGQNIRKGVTVGGVTGQLIGGIEKPQILILRGDTGAASTLNYNTFGPCDVTPIVQSNDQGTGSGGGRQTFSKDTLYVATYSYGVSSFNSFVSNIPIDVTNVDIIFLRMGAIRTGSAGGSSYAIGVTAGRDDRATNYAAKVSGTPTTSLSISDNKIDVSSLSGMYYLKGEVTNNASQAETDLYVSEIVLAQKNK